MKQGICLSLSELRTLLTRSKAERDRIAEFVDLSGQELCRLREEEAAELAACLTEKQLPCMGIHSTFPAEIALIGTKKSELELEAYIRRLVRRCELLDCRIIGVGSPISRQRDEQQTEAEADKQMVQTLQLLAQLAGGRMILLESISPTQTNYICSAAHAQRLVRQTNRKNVGILADLYHLRLCTEELEKLGEDFWAQVGYLHIADPAGRRCLSQTTDADFRQYTQTAVRRAVNCRCIAVEADIEDILEEGPCCAQLLRMWIKETEGC